jgi:hypothetical protein
MNKNNWSERGGMGKEGGRGSDDEGRGWLRKIKQKDHDERRSKQCTETNKGTCIQHWSGCGTRQMPGGHNVAAAAVSASARKALFTNKKWL